MKYKSSFEEVWEARRQIFDLCHRSPKELIEYYISLQNKNDILKNSINKKPKNKIRSTNAIISQTNN
jgi:hypothetical protein